MSDPQDLDAIRRASIQLADEALAKDPKVIQANIARDSIAVGEMLAQRQRELRPRGVDAIVNGSRKPDDIQRG